MKKIKFPSELAYILGMILMPFAVSLSIKANFGMSMISAPTYIISEKTILTNGQAEWILQAIFLVLMCIILKKFRVAYLSSFASAFIYGLILDLAIYLTGFFTAESIIIRALLFVCGMVLTSVSVALFFNTYLAPVAYDYFVSLIVKEKNLNLRKFKHAFDYSMLALSAVLSLTLFRGFVGINFGTIIMALCNGYIISYSSKLMNKYLDFYDILPLRRHFETQEKTQSPEE